MSGVQIDVDGLRTKPKNSGGAIRRTCGRSPNLDILTQVPNRARFFGELGRVITEFGGTGRRIVAGLVDLDRFKEVNDSFGHAIGDELLIKVAEVLTANVRSDEMVARLSGDEFAFFILLGVVDDKAHPMSG